MPKLIYLESSFIEVSRRPRIGLVPVALASLLVALVGGCVEENHRPTAQDLQVIQKNILREEPLIEFRVNASLEGKVTYLGLDVDPEVITPGKPFKLTHYWKVIEPVTDWRIFVHLNDPEQARFINTDHTPIGGRYPVSHWKRGEIIRDEHTVNLPKDWRFSQVVVYTGLFRGEMRMKIHGPQDKEDRIIAATLPVKKSGSQPQPKPKRLVALKAKKPVLVDGRLDEAVWKKAPSTGFFRDAYNGSALPYQTEARVAWDRRHLYIAFECRDPDIFSELKERDAKLWLQDAVEVFIDANRDGEDYLELQTNPQGAIFDSYFPRHRLGQADFNSGLRVAVSVLGTLNKRDDEDQRWIVEMALPWKDARGRGKYELLLPPRPGDLWRVNFLRVDVSRGRPQRAGAWSPPLSGDFHTLSSFGELVFMK
jgi:hypothetical protein